MNVKIEKEKNDKNLIGIALGGGGVRGVSTSECFKI